MITVKYFFDTYAIMEIIKKNINYEKFREEEIVTSVLNLAEMYYGLLKYSDKKTALEWFNKLKSFTLNIDAETIRKAMEFKFENKQKNLSFIDCIGYAVAKEHNILFLTGDKEFEKFENVEFVK